MYHAHSLGSISRIKRIICLEISGKHESVFIWVQFAILAPMVVLTELDDALTVPLSFSSCVLQCFAFLEDGYTTRDAFAELAAALGTDLQTPKSKSRDNRKQRKLERSSGVKNKVGRPIAGACALLQR